MIGRRLYLSSLFVACGVACGASPPATSVVASTPETDAIEWDGGLWFDGASFARRTMYTTHGVFSDTPPASIAHRIDLHGGYVVPPFGDAHHHGIDSEEGLDAKIAAFLHDGIFYVKNPNVIPDLLTPAVRARINRPDSIDVAFSNGGLTSTGGHPAPLHDTLARRGVFKGLGPGDMENRAYFLIDSEADLDSKWPRILAGKPDFIKTFLVFADGQPIPSNMPPDFAKGLDAKMLPAIVSRAHAAGLRVSSHIDTALDFRIAVDAGVDEINHLPFPFGPSFSREHPASCMIDAETAKLAGEKHIIAVSTQAPRGLPTPEPEVLASVLEQQRGNVRTLMAAGVKIAVGSDGISGEVPFPTALGEASYLHESATVDNRTLLEMWCETTARTIFPARKLGRLANGYEASFLVLEGDPIADFENVKRIRVRVKQGRELARE